MRRLAAFATDWLIFAAWGAALFGVAWWLQDGKPQWPQNPWLSQGLGFVCTTLPFGAYLALCEASVRQATPGKRAFGLVVTSAAGRRIGPGQAIARTAVKLAPWELGHLAAHHIMSAAREGSEPGAWLWAFAAGSMLLGLFYVAQVWSRSGRTLFDRVADTQVARQAI